jgi:hypothetical protein
MRKSARILLSLAAAFFGTIVISGTIMKGSTAYCIHTHRFDAPWYSYVMLGAMFGSLIISPMLFALCYRLLSKYPQKLT